MVKQNTQVDMYSSYKTNKELTIGFDQKFTFGNVKKHKKKQKYKFVIIIIVKLGRTIYLKVIKFWGLPFIKAEGKEISFLPSIAPNVMHLWFQ